MEGLKEEREGEEWREENNEEVGGKDGQKNRRVKELFGSSVASLVEL